MTGPKGNSEFCFLETLNVNARSDWLILEHQRAMNMKRVLGK